MKGWMKAFVGAVCLVTLVGCYGGMVTTTAKPVGLIWADAKGPIMATSAERGSKTGTATAKSILGLVATGDCSIAAAARNGGITKIKTVDYYVKNVLGIIAEIRVEVTGE